MESHPPFPFDQQGLVALNAPYPVYDYVVTPPAGVMPFSDLMLEQLFAEVARDLRKRNR